MLPQLPLVICAVVETGLNQLRLQALDEYERQHQLHNKVIKLQLSQLSFPLYLLFNQQIQVYSYYTGDVGVTVDADLTTLYQLTEGSNLTELIKQDKLCIDGDMATLQAFSHYLQQNPFDFAELFSKYIGDVPTHFLENSFKQGKALTQKIYQQTQLHLRELAIEEYRLIPNKLEFYAFKDDLEDLIIDINQAEARLLKLQNKVKK